MRRLGSRRGQVLLMTTFSLVAMTGMLALAVDVGWGHFLKRSAQKAADAAALAAAYRVFLDAGEGSEVPCGSAVICQEPVPCPAEVASTPASNIDAACLYAQNHGFQTGGSNGRQTVSVAADTTSPRVTRWSFAVAGSRSYEPTPRR